MRGVHTSSSIRPSSTIPICLDLGTNNPKNLEDPLYLGLRRTRVPNDEMTQFMEEFMREMSLAFPQLLVQFEVCTVFSAMRPPLTRLQDFSTEHAFTYLDMFRHRYPLFNDDIQGTGCVILSGFLNAAKLSSAASGLPLSEHRILFLGAGSAGVGVATQLMSFFTLQGLSEQQARERVWFVDSQGLIYDARGKMAEHKRHFARKDYTGPPLTDLVDIIEYVKPTALLGLSTTKVGCSSRIISRRSS
jgi:malate dehydrogenase (oxaloacetate-decarboxylating)(NADP+)